MMHSVLLLVSRSRMKITPAHSVVILDFYIEGFLKKLSREPPVSRNKGLCREGNIKSF